MARCNHEHLLFDVLEHASQGGHKQADESAIREAIQGQRHVSTHGNGAFKEGQPAIRLPPPSTFPAPALVPGDLLYEDGEDRDPQTVADFHAVRRPYLDPRRTTMYVLQLPTVPQNLEGVQPAKQDGEVSTIPEQPVRPVRRGPERAARAPAKPSLPDTPSIAPPKVESVLAYLQAFYHGIPVRLLPTPSRFHYTEWPDSNSNLTNPSQPSLKKQKRSHPSPPHPIALSTTTHLTRIRTRPSRDKISTLQLNLSDLLDTAISILPRDAYALLMLTDNDLYEDDEDDFCCGRAYGGSHVAIVSSARYNPALDRRQDIDLSHSWPGSHCRAWVSGRWTRKKPVLMDEVRTEVLAVMEDEKSAIAAAVLAANEIPLPDTAEQRAALWLGRVCKTASHELGHCVGIGHCEYYACIMQGTANIAEDARQPPYLCPVDLVKVLQATGAGEKERYLALMEVCGRWAGVDRMFAAFYAWLEGRVLQPDVVAGTV